MDLHDPFIQFLRSLSGREVHFFPKSGNAGDAFITYATYKLFDEFGINCVPHKECDNVSGKIVLIGGGGNLVEGRYHEVRELILRLGDDNDVTLLPHTVVGNADILQKTYQKLTLFCRERVSYEQCLQNGANPNATYLTHDLTFFLDKRHLSGFQSTGSGELKILRSDGESLREGQHQDGDIDISLSWNGDIWQSPKFCEYVTKSLAAYIEPYEYIVTDRLHVSILAALLGKNVTLRPNAYFKNKAIYEHTLSSHFKNVVFDEDVREGFDEVREDAESQTHKEETMIELNQDSKTSAVSRPRGKVVAMDWALDNQFIESVLASADNDCLVSLDIFDTAITRHYDSPVDVFCEVESRLVDQYGVIASGFASARELAERAARERHFHSRGAQEITLNDIYCQLPESMPRFHEWEHAKSVELEVELDAIHAIPDVLEITRRLVEKNQPYIFVSDMYLPASFLAKLLHKAGYGGWSDLYVSGELGTTKATGLIWDRIRERYPNKEILHIGDDLHADVNTPRDRRISTRHYVRGASERRTVPRLAPSVLPFSRARRGQVLSARAHLAGALSDEQAWFDLGEAFGGLVVGTFIKWLSDRVRLHGIKKLYFCARDGYLLHRAWKAAGFQEKLAVETHYLAVSRAALNIAKGVCASTPAHLEVELRNLLISPMFKGKSLREILRAADLLEIDDLVSDSISTFGSLDDCIDPGWGFPEFHRLLERHSASVYTKLKVRHENCMQYLQQEGFLSDDRKAMVDMGWHGSMQTSLRTLIRNSGGKDELFGFYYGLWPKAQENRYRAGLMDSCFASEFIQLQKQAEVHQGVALLEQLHSAPHGSTSRYESQVDGSYAPIFTENSLESEQFERITTHFQNGVVQAIGHTFRSAPERMYDLADLTRDAAISAMGALFISPTIAELDLLSRVGHCATYDHGSHEPIIQRSIPADYNEMCAVLLDSEWHFGQLKHWWRIANDAQRAFLRRFISEHLHYLDERVFRNFF